MALQLYNTLTRKKEPFKPVESGHARIYVCGKTVYDYMHIGHARCYTIYDVLVRHLRASSIKVTYVRNVTDIDDKIIKRSSETGEDPIALAARFTKCFWEDTARLGCVRPDVEPKVSDHLDEIRTLIQRLIDTGHAYESDGDVYYSVSSFPGYLKLSRRKLDQPELGASGRTADAEVARKRHAADFALWKRSPAGEKSWPSPWSDGRPGWHIECSAMSMKHLGETLDLHGGGLDLVFPHHENEIAQSEAATGKPFAKLWMHNGFIETNPEKMSKSLGNFFTAREVYERIEPEAVRYFMMTVHYRAPLAFDWTVDGAGNVTGFPQLEEAERRVEYYYATLRRLASIPPERIVDETGAAPREVADFPRRLTESLDDDLNMPVSLASVAEFLKGVNELCDRAMAKKGRLSRDTFAAAMLGFTRLRDQLGLATQDPESVLTRIRDRRAKQQGVAPAEVEAAIDARAQARVDKDFARADAIRGDLAKNGIELLDGPTGTTWRVL
jgi:cysteinyl-tRNA synthetase